MAGAEITVGTFTPGSRLADMLGAEVIREPLYAVLIGEGSPLVLLHGLAVSGDMYAPIIPALAKHHRLIIPDLRGQGASALLPGPFTPVQLTDDLVALLRHLELRQATVLGYSQGGPIAQQLAHDHPDLVGGLILVCTYAFNRATRRERFEGHLIPWMFRILGTRVMGQLSKSGMTGGKAMTKEQAAWIARLVAETPRKAGVQLAQGAMAFDGREWLREISVPTLVVTGAEDKAVPPHHGTMLTDWIPGARRVEVAGAGHFLICTHPAEMVHIIESWFAATAQSGPPPAQSHR